MLFSPRLVRWAGGASLLTAAGLALAVGAAPPALPAAARYEKLPELFKQALDGARSQVAAHPGDPEPVRRLAHLYQANRLYPEARACYAVIAATPPGLGAPDHYLLADIDQNENDLAGAVAELRAVARAEPGYLPARLALAAALFKSGDTDQAGKEYSAVVALEANQPQASLGLARIELQRGDDDAAVARLEEVMAVHADFTSGAGLLAQLLERRGEADRAVAMTQWSLQKPEQPPPDPWLGALLADCYDTQRLSLTFEEYFKVGRMDEAVPILDRLAALDPDGPIAKIFAGFSHAKALQHITAVRDYYEALGRGGDPEKVCPYLTQSLLALGRVSEAMDLMATYTARMPDSIPLAKAYAELALKQGDTKLARALLEKVLQREPNLQAQNMSLARILWTSGERDAAAKCLQRVAAIYADDVPSRALLGEYYLGRGEPRSAIKPLEQARARAVAKTPAQVQLTGLLATAYLQTANAEAGKGQWTSAENHFDLAIRLVPADLDAYAGKANACAQLGEFRRAAETLERMSALDPDNPTILLSIGDMVYQDGDPAAARMRWQRARQLVAAADHNLRAALDDRLSGRITADTFK